MKVANVAKFYSRGIKAKSPGASEGKVSEGSPLSVRHLEALLQTFCLLCEAERYSKGCPGARAAPSAPGPAHFCKTPAAFQKPRLI